MRNKRTHLTNIKWKFLPPHQYQSRDYIGSCLLDYNINLSKSRPNTANPLTHASSQDQSVQRPASAFAQRARERAQQLRRMEDDKIEGLKDKAEDRKRRAKLSFRSDYRPFHNGALAKYCPPRQVAELIGSSSATSDEVLAAPEKDKANRAFQKVLNQRERTQQWWNKAWGKEKTMKIIKYPPLLNPMKVVRKAPLKSPQAAEVRKYATTVLIETSLARFRKNLKWRGLSVKAETRANEQNRILQQRRQKIRSSQSHRQKTESAVFDPDSIEFLAARYGSWVGKRKERRQSVTLIKMMETEKKNKKLLSLH